VLVAAARSIERRENHPMTGLAPASEIVGWLLALLAVFGTTVSVAGAAAVHQFATRRRYPARQCPAVTVLKPLCGNEPRLDEALASICEQTYPAPVQIVFGVQDPADPALLAVHRLQARFPDRDIAVATGAQAHGPNRKICNLINMLPLARHDVLVFSDSDLHVAPDYVERLVAALEVPGTGLATTVCTGLPTVRGLAARLGATHISHSFLPAVLLSRVLGRQDCLGTTMALLRDTLAEIGGLHALVRHLADDNVLSQRVRRLGLQVQLADTVPATGIPNASPRALWQHELRWARTIRALQPLGFAASVLQFPLFWAAAAVALTGGASWSIGLFALAWAVRAAAALGINRMLRHGCAPQVAAPLWLLPLRDILSVAEVVASFLGGSVVWRGHTLVADNGREVAPHGDAYAAMAAEPASAAF
jgi:ceramide glucosyltransferase